MVSRTTRGAQAMRGKTMAVAAGAAFLIVSACQRPKENHCFEETTLPSPKISVTTTRHVGKGGNKTEFSLSLSNPDSISFRSADEEGSFDFRRREVYVLTEPEDVSGLRSFRSLSFNTRSGLDYEATPQDALTAGCEIAQQILDVHRSATEESSSYPTDDASLNESIRAVDKAGFVKVAGEFKKSYCGPS
jgi:hypothetical protein